MGRRSTPRSLSILEKERRIGTRIAELRREAGLSLAELAAKVQPPTTAPTIDKIEKSVTRPRMEWIYKLADAFGIHYLEILEPLAPEEARLLGYYRGMSEEKAGAIIQVAEAMAQTSPPRNGHHQAAPADTPESHPFRKAR